MPPKGTKVPRYWECSSPRASPTDGGFLGGSTSRWGRAERAGLSDGRFWRAKIGSPSARFPSNLRTCSVRIATCIPKLLDGGTTRARTSHGRSTPATVFFYLLISKSFSKFRSTLDVLLPNYYINFNAVSWV